MNNNNNFGFLLNIHFHNGHALETRAIKERLKVFRLKIENWEPGTGNMELLPTHDSRLTTHFLLTTHDSPLTIHVNMVTSVNLESCMYNDKDFDHRG